ncbi:Coumaroyl-CoA:anthocyanidin 3-O-glucoside-6''-O-coumaroyltransferase 1 [Linum grandiflorum]
MAEYSSAVKTTAELQISPPPGSLPSTTTIRLTVFDVPWLICHPVQRVFFYHLPTISAPQFHNSIISKLTSSLSAALAHFYPFAAKLITPPPPAKPYILYSENDAVSFTVAESIALDFQQATSDSPTDVRLLHPLLPKLTKFDGDGDGVTTVSNLLALKVTLFPDSGFCIGIEFRHVAADGLAFNQFVKSWAEISKSGGAMDEFSKLSISSPPCHDKELIEENRVMEDKFLENFWSFKSPWDGDSLHRLLADKVRSTFSISADQISRMKALVNNYRGGKLKPSHPATAFAVTSALIWSSLIKSEQPESKEDEEDKLDCYAFPVDCRGRMQPKLPAGYFGNCLSGIRTLVRRKDLIGDDGIAIAAREIGRRIKEIEAEGAVRSVEKYYSFSEWRELLRQGVRVVTVAGSTKLGVYETDFGWGRPSKSEPVHVDFSGSVYFSDGRDVEKGGIEFGLSLKRAEMNSFVAVFESQLDRFNGCSGANVCS